MTSDTIGSNEPQLLTLFRLRMVGGRGEGGKTPPWYILLYNFLLTHPGFIKFGDFL